MGGNAPGKYFGPTWKKITDNVSKGPYQYPSGIVSPPWPSRLATGLSVGTPECEGVQEYVFQALASPCPCGIHETRGRTW
jgi:hypothetical protein